MVDNSNPNVSGHKKQDYLSCEDISGATERLSMSSCLGSAPSYATTGLYARAPTKILKCDTGFTKEAVSLHAGHSSLEADTIFRHDFHRNHIYRTTRKVTRVLRSGKYLILDGQCARTTVGTERRGVVSIKKAVVSRGERSMSARTWWSLPAPMSQGSIPNVIYTLQHQGEFSVSGKPRANNPIPLLTPNMYYPLDANGDAAMQHLSLFQTNNTSSIDVEMGEPGGGWAEMEIYDDDVHMEGVVGESFDPDITLMKPDEDFVIVSTQYTWGYSSGFQGEHLLVSDRSFWGQKEDTFSISGAYSREYSLASSSVTLANEGAAAIGPGDCTGASVDCMLAMFAATRLGADAGLFTAGPLRVGAPQWLFLSTD